MIEIKHLNKKQLLHFVNSSEFNESKDIPISVHRAISQINNPRAKDDDVLLLLAYHQNEMCGYLGIVPEIIYPPNKEAIRIGWLSCLWVSQNHRGKKISIRLIEQSFALWSNNIVLSDYVPGIKIIYDRTGSFDDPPYTRKGVRLYVGSDLYHLLPPKGKVFHYLKWGLAILDNLINGFQSIRLKLIKEDISDLRLEYVDRIDKELNSFIKEKQGKELMRRQINELNWMLNYPWVLSVKEKDELNKRYYFSSTAKSFGYFSIKVFQEDKQITFLILSKREDNLKLIYLYHEDCIPSIVRVLKHLLIKWNIKTFTSCHTQLAKALMNSKTPALFKKEIKRNYLIAHKLEEIFYADIELQDGDGDYAFT